MGREEDLFNFWKGRNTVKETCQLKRKPPFCVVVLLSKLADAQRNADLRNIVLQMQKDTRDHNMPYLPT